MRPGGGTSRRAVQSFVPEGAWECKSPLGHSRGMDWSLVPSTVSYADHAGSNPAPATFERTARRRHPSPFLRCGRFSVSGGDLRGTECAALRGQGCAGQAKALPSRGRGDPGVDGGHDSNQGIQQIILDAGRPCFLDAAPCTYPTAPVTVTARPIRCFSRSLKKRRVVSRSQILTDLRVVKCHDLNSRMLKHAVVPVIPALRGAC